jgi:hypothetical protein
MADKTAQVLRGAADKDCGGIRLPCSSGAGQWAPPRPRTVPPFLGRRAFFGVLPKVSAALNKFVSPVASSGSLSSRQNSERSFRVLKGGGHDPDEHKKDSSGFRREEPPRVPQPRKETPGHPPPTATPGVSARDGPQTPTMAFIQLIASLAQQSFIGRWLAILAYRSSTRQQRSSSRLKRGAVVDRQVE